MKKIVRKCLNWIAPKVGAYLVENKIPIKFEVKDAKIKTLTVRSFYSKDRMLVDEEHREYVIKNISKEIGLSLLEEGMIKIEESDVPYNPIFDRDHSRKILTLTVKVVPYEVPYEV